MDNDTLVLLAVGIVVVAYQAFVSLVVARCKFFASRQRLLQYLLIWLVPMLGALVCHAVAHSHEGKVSTDDSLVKHYEKADEYGTRLRNPPDSSDSNGGVEGDGGE